MSNTDKAIKLITRLGTVDERITSLQAERESLSYEISVLVGNTSVPPTTTGKKTTTKTTNGKHKKAVVGSLGEKIITFLQSNPGMSNAKIAKAMKVAPNKTALSLYHLVKKNMAFTTEGAYFTSLPLTAAAKTVPAQEDNDL